MIDNEEFKRELASTLKVVFKDAAEQIKKESEERFKEQRISIDNRLWKFLTVAIVVLLAVFSGLYAMINSNDTEIHLLNKATTELQTDVGIIDGACKEKHPESNAFGDANIKYIKRRGKQ